MSATTPAASLRLGARVVAIEPQPAFASWLRWLFRNQPEITVVESALAAAPGDGRAVPQPAHPHSGDDVAGRGSTRCARAAASEQASAGPKRSRCRAITLDALIARHGVPRFCKIDVEGYEAEVLRGLTQPIPALSFEYLPAAIDVAVAAAAARLAALGRYRCNVTIGERRRFLWPEWRPLADLDAWLAARLPHEPSGDVYARLES